MPAGNPRLGWGIGAGILLLLLPLVFLDDLRASAREYVVLVTAATLLLYGAVLLVARGRLDLTPRAILTVALLLRATVFPLAPSLSDDAWRYVWDGRLLLHGANPYHRVPADESLRSFHDSLFALQGYPTTNTIYPPLTQLTFAASVAVGEAAGDDPRVGYYIWKLFLVAAELGAIVLLLRLLRGLRRSVGWSIIYAWHPLAVVELAGQGHTDGLWVAALGLAVAGYLFRGSGGGLAGLAFGGAARIFPFLLAPLWMRFLSGRSRIAGLLLSLPFLISLLPLLDPTTFRIYFAVGARFTNYYEFNGGIYYGLKWVLDSFSIAPSNRIAGAIGVVCTFIGLIALWGAPLRGRRFGTLLARTLGIITLHLLLATKVHVWYFVAPLYLIAIHPDKRLTLPWLWAGLIGPLTYLMYASPPFTERTWVIWLEWGGFLLLLLYGVVRERKAGRRGRSIEEEEGRKGERPAL